MTGEELARLFDHGPRLGAALTEEVAHHLKKCDQGEHANQRSA